jgi:hypothetical protein
MLYVMPEPLGAEIVIEPVARLHVGCCIVTVGATTVGQQ